MPRQPSANTVSCVGRKRVLLGWAVIGLGVAVTCLWTASRWYSYILRYTWGPAPTAMVVECVGGRVDVIVDPLDRRKSAVKFLWKDQRAWHWSARAERSPADEGLIIDWPILHYDRVEGVSPPGTPPPIVARRLIFVLWPIPPVLIAAGTLLVRSGARARSWARHRACPACGYSMKGLAADAACPECGKEVA